MKQLKGALMFKAPHAAVFITGQTCANRCKPAAKLHCSCAETIPISAWVGGRGCFT